MKSILFLFSLYLLTGSAGWSTEPEAPRCESVAHLPRPELGGSPVVEAWITPAARPLWQPSPCFPWVGPHYNKLAGVSGTLHHAGPATDLLARFGSISSMQGMTYWSVKDRRLERLIVQAYAIDDPRSGRERPNYMASEMRPERPLYFAEQDNRTKDRVIYKISVREIGNDRFVVDWENVSRVRLAPFTFFGVGDLRSTYVLERITDDLWAYYSLTGVHENVVADLWGDAQGKSYINRALALYSFIANVPADISLPWAK